MVVGVEDAEVEDVEEDDNQSSSRTVYSLI